MPLSWCFGEIDRIVTPNSARFICWLHKIEFVKIWLGDHQRGVDVVRRPTNKQWHSVSQICFKVRLDNSLYTRCEQRIFIAMVSLSTEASSGTTCSIGTVMVGTTTTSIVHLVHWGSNRASCSLESGREHVGRLNNSIGNIELRSPCC